jgi:myo-inositol-1(or 4)-monophosphatase
VACGRTEAFFERYLKPWDFAAGYLLICEAGGQVTDFWGQPVDMAKPSSIVASNGIYPELIKLFANQPVM